MSLINQNIAAHQALAAPRRRALHLRLAVQALACLLLVVAAHLAQAVVAVQNHRAALRLVAVRQAHLQVAFRHRAAPRRARAVFLPFPAVQARQVLARHRHVQAVAVLQRRRSAARHRHRRLFRHRQVQAVHFHLLARAVVARHIQAARLHLRQAVQPCQVQAHQVVRFIG